MKILPVIGYQRGAREFWEKLLSLGIKEDYDNPEKILVLGGDGTLMGAERDYYQRGVPFVGIAFGTVNFLLNRGIERSEDLVKKLEEDKWLTYDMQAIEVEVHTEAGVQRGIAFNDVFLERVNVAGGAHLKLTTLEYPGIDVRGNGLIVATPQGSTAYNRNAGGTILPLRSLEWCVTGICTSRRLDTTVERQEITVDVIRGNVSLVTDNKEFKKVRHAKLFPSKWNAKICFDESENFRQRRYA